MMKRLATVLMAMAVAGAWSGTVRMGALSTDTTVETLGEGAAAVQLLSKAKIDSMIEALSVATNALALAEGAGAVAEAALGFATNALPKTGGEVSGFITASAFQTLPDPDLGLTSLFTPRFISLGYDSALGPLGPGVLNIRQDRIEGVNSYGKFWKLYYPTNHPTATFATLDDIPNMGGYATTGAVAAVQAAVGAGTNWLTRTGLSGTVAFANDGGRPQAWSGTGALTVSGFTGLTPPTQVYWTMSGFSSVTLPAGVYAVGGGSWQTNMVNHFTIWQAGTSVLMSFITATED